MATERKTILSIEDNQDIANLIRIMLRHAPVDVLQAQNGEEAWAILEKQIPDLILLDVMLPLMNGLDFLAKLKQESRYQAIPVIVISVRADASYRKRAEELGVKRYILKPFSPAMVRQEVEQVLGVNWKEHW